VPMPTDIQHTDENPEHVSQYFTSPASSSQKPFLVRVGTKYMELDDGGSTPVMNMPTSMPVPSTSSMPAMPSSRPSTPNLAPKEHEHNAAIAAENIEILGSLVATIFTDPEHKPTGYLYDSERFGQIGRRYCPGFTVAPGDSRKGCIVRVLDADAYDVACDMITRAQGNQSATNAPSSEKPPVVLNLANQYTRGGGWRKGAMAQEEELCYRSTLYASLPSKYYPMKETGAIYSPLVAIFRTRGIHGHELYPMAKYIRQLHQDSHPGGPPPAPLPVVSVISIAAIRDPPVTKDKPPKYARTEDRVLTKSKIRLALRMAAYNGHRRVVLGALGCGAFHNPNREVARLFKEVFGEEEFTGGWWQEITFAVLDTAKLEDRGVNGQGNFGVFYRELNGVIV